MAHPRWLREVLGKGPTSQFLLFGLLLSTTLLLVLLLQTSRWDIVFAPLNNWVLGVEKSYFQWFKQQNTSNPLLLLLLAYGGGVIASISPCILTLLPVNLSYIGTREIHSRWDALVKASSFVLGVVTVLSILGVFSSLASLVMVQYQGYVQLAIGLVIIVMGLSLLGLIQLPLPQVPTAQPKTATQSLRLRLPPEVTGPYTVGLTFALLSSPCTSPILFSFLAVAASRGSQLQSVFIMVSYALGYTTVIFWASLFTGFAKQARGLLQYSETIASVSSLILLVLGGYYLISGSRWILAL